MKISIIGCGNMGSGLAHRLSKDHTLQLFSRNKQKTQALANELNATAFSTAAEAMENADIVILGVKPQFLNDVAPVIKDHFKKSQLLISILSGITVSTLRQYFGEPLIMRMMPNMAVVQGKGVVALAENPEIPSDLKHQVEKMCKPLGFFHWMPEDKINAIAALTGSGPAFAFLLIEAMVDAAIAMGFNSKQGHEYVLEMLEGTIGMLKETGKHPGELKWQITSPSGTTIAGIKVMEESGVRGIIMNTFLAAHQRALQLAAENKK